MSEDDVLDSFFEEDFVMKLLNFKKKTMDTYRSEGSDRIPPSIKLGTRWVYPKEKLIEWARAKGILLPVKKK
jgi:predicted DNA-binding transcriptional regulator AlpA